MVLPIKPIKIFNIYTIKNSSHMLHIRNSIKGIFILENNGTPTTTITDFSEPIINGSLCIDRTNQKLYILKSNTWILVGSDIDNVIQISYSELQNLVINAQLSIGTIYMIVYETIHLIPHTTDINIGGSETLLLSPNSDNSFYTNVISLSFPNDIIRYDFNDNMAEDLTTPRKGKITYRKDTIRNIETWYDWRNVTFRRWSIDQTTLNVLWVQNDGTEIPHQYNINDTVRYANKIYKCIEGYQSLTHGPPPTLPTKWIKILDYSTNIFWSWLESGLYIYINGTPIYSGLLYNDVTTFGQSYTTNIETSIKNISIGKCKNSINYGYNNIVFGIETSVSPELETNDIVFNINCVDMTINSKNTYSNIFGTNCNNMLINKGFKNNILGSNNTYSSYGIDVELNQIGKNSNNNILSDNTKNIILGNNNTSQNISDNSNNIKIGNDSRSCIIGQNSNNISIGNITGGIFISDSIEYVTIGDNVLGIFIIGYNNDNLEIGNNCIGIELLGGGCGNTKIGSGSSNITITSSNNNSIGSNNSLINLNGGNNNFNTIGSNNNDIILNGACNNNSIGSNNSSINLNGVCNSNIIPNKCESISLEFGSNNNSFSNNTISLDTSTFTLNNVKVLLKNNVPITLTNTYSDIVVDMISPDDTLWFKSIDNSGSVINTKFI